MVKEEDNGELTRKRKMIWKFICSESRKCHVVHEAGVLAVKKSHLMRLVKHVFRCV